MVTDATCYMEWIAEQYGMELEESYRQKLRDNQPSLYSVYRRYQ